MKKVLIAACVLFSTAVFAQQKKTSTTKTTVRKGPSFSPEKMKMLCQPWKLDTVETFGVVKPANAKEQNDGITMMADSTLFLTMEGKVSTGKWMPGTWGPQYIHTTVINVTKPIMFKIIKLSDNYMQLEYQDEELTKTEYYYSVKKKQ